MHSQKWAMMCSVPLPGREVLVKLIAMPVRRSDSKIAAAVFSSRFVTRPAMAKIWSAACRVSAATRSQ